VDDDRVRELIQRLAAETNFSSPTTRSLAAELAALVAANESARAIHLLKQHLSRDHHEIPADLLRLAEEIRPFLRRRWKWEQRSDGKNHWLVMEKTGVACYEPVKLAGQRGLSLARIEQLDSLRQRCISLNRALRQNIGEPAKLGKSKRGIELPDPCPDILDRLDALKEQRVNQTAHLIVAQALGVRLAEKTPEKLAKIMKLGWTERALRVAQSRETGPDTNRSWRVRRWLCQRIEREAQARSLHGVYEKFRQPVDFIAIENLEYYNMTQRRERSTNARLMKWCRRQLRDKLIMLCEPYGLRVVEVWPADTSKFCSLTGVAGFRAVELNPDDAENFRWKKHLIRLREADARKRKLDDEDRKESQRIKALFDQLTELNKDLLAEREKARAEGRHFRPKWRTLHAPMPLGPLFVPASATETITRRNKMTGDDEQVAVFKPVNERRPTVLQADINAAINIGLRAIASPQADDIHARIRAKSDGKTFAVRADNKREEARWGDNPPQIVVTDTSSREKLLADKWLNFYFDLGAVATFDDAAINGIRARVVSGRGIWGTIKGNDRREGIDWQRCLAINAARLRGRGLTPPVDWENDDVSFTP
jgi:IS605 OrfB family transposase